MKNTESAKKISGTIIPKQSRAKKSYETLLNSAQDILQEHGLQALNSNAIVERAGVTTPVFYRYFKDKNALLTVLGSRLTEQQNNVTRVSMLSVDLTTIDFDEIEIKAKQVLIDTYKVTQAFTGSYALLVSLRAVPQLFEIRQASSHKIAETLSGALQQIRPELSNESAYTNCRLAAEIVYTSIEMLLADSGLDSVSILEKTASSVITVFKS